MAEGYVADLTLCSGVHRIARVGTGAADLMRAAASDPAVGAARPRHQLEDSIKPAGSGRGHPHDDRRT
jgi:hypothetical protein